MSARKPRAAKAPKPETPANANADAASSGDDIERVRVEKEIQVAASASEIGSLALDHAKVTIAISALLDEIAAFSTARRKKLRELRKEELRLANAVTSNTTTKLISGFEIRDYRLNQVRFEDEAGRELAPAQPMPAAMRQRQLFDDAGGVGAPLDVGDLADEDDL
jgi:hypothetical protein